jgi:RNA 2',3'-cyclic 3'-phosphodiesterase
VFFATELPADVANDAVQVANSLKSKFGLEREVFASSRLHLALTSVCDPGIEAGKLFRLAMLAAGRVRAKQFYVRFGLAKAVSRSRGKPSIVLVPDEGADQITDLATALNRELNAHGIADEVGNYQPHIKLFNDYAAFPNVPVPPVSWRVKNFVLCRSVPGEKRTEVIQLWPLEPPASTSHPRG